MKKIAKVLVCLVIIAVMVLAPVGAKEGPGPDDRPIGHVEVVN